jgi:argininosuccinate synthase
MEKVVLAYSGGLDTSVAIRWINEQYNMEVVTVTANLGNQRDLDAVQEKALRTGAVRAYVHDAREDFIRYFVWPSLAAGAMYEDRYPLATALARPLIAKILVDYARAEGATAVAHGCTGKGNDQVRFDVSVGALAPDLKIIAPVREWRMNRDDEIAYAQKHDIPVPVTTASPYSVDENLWGRSIEAGILEDAWNEPPDDAYAWTINPRYAPDEPSYIEIEFEQGIPVALDGERIEGIDLIGQLTELAGAHGIGRIDHVENRFVGIKSREIYECPAATVLHLAHQEIEKLTLTRDQMRFKARVAQEISDLTYNGFWFSALQQDLFAFVASTQRNVTGVARLKLFKGQVTAVGRKSPNSLYVEAQSTYGAGDLFDHDAAVGFISLAGLPLRTYAQVNWPQLTGDQLLRITSGQTESPAEE